MMRSTSWKLLFILLCMSISVNADNCQIAFTENAQEVAESMYLIDLSIKNTTHGMASTYFPDTQYDIIIRPKSTTLSFKEFHFKMENENRSRSYGALELREPELSTFDTHNYCFNRVVNLATPNKPNITIGWQSPPTKSGCIQLKTFIKETELRYHTASLRVCEDSRIELDDPGEILRNCCACTRAKYEMSFQGMWSKYSHPRSFPRQDWIVGFPIAIGASHNRMYHMWDTYTNASDALKKFAETGNSLDLELDLKSKRDNITTLIKFRGTNFKNKTNARAQLQVDRMNHLVSLVARINPSPDWFVGVSSLELCTSDCSWMKEKMLNLYAYDVGSKNGYTFEATDLKQTNDVINRMNMSWPEPPPGTDIVPPFYDKTNNTHEVRPMALIHFKLIRTFGSTCRDESKTDDSCVSPWNLTIECSVSCGKGLKVSRREYLEGYNANNCKANLEMREPCVIDVKCDEEVTEENCQLSDWSNWESCKRTCGQETIRRTRSFKDPEYVIKCTEKFPDISQSEYKDCGHPPCPNGKTECDNALYRPWKEWGPCSVTVGQGIQYRVREKIANVITQGDLFKDAGYIECTYDKKVCDGVDPSSITEAPIEEHEPGVEIIVSTSSPEHSQPPECLYQVDDGVNCDGTYSEYLHRWAYHRDSNDCKMFSYKGCGGNENRFLDRKECYERCYIGETRECQMSEWSEWTGCRDCVFQETRVRTVEVEPSPFAKPCPRSNRFQSRACPKC